MNQINNILAPVDFSEDSLKALEYAVEMAKRTNANLYVVHAYRLIKPENLGNESRGAALKKELENSLNFKFKELEFEYLVSHPIDYQLILEVGFANDVIQAMILDKKIDLVIMGSRGNIENEEIFGSTTWSVIKSINCPVLAVPKEAGSVDIKHIILANESQEFDDTDDFYMIDRIAQSFQTDVTILKSKPLNGKLSSKINSDHFFKGLKINSLFCGNEEMIEAIKEQLKQYQGDFLVLMPEENVFLSSYFKRGNLKEIILDTHIPLLMIQKPLLDEL